MLGGDDPKDGSSQGPGADLMAQDTPRSAEERARSRANDYSGMLWHIATFIIINGMLWTMDLIQGGGLDWAYWITLFWGIGLAFHVAWYFIEVSRRGERYERFLADEQRGQGA